MTNSPNEALVAARLASDPRIAAAKKMILEALEEHRSALTGVRPPNSSLKKSYEETLNRFAEMRGGKLWYPYLGSGIGNGALVELEDGSIKYDFIGGIGPHYWGHSHPEIVSAALDGALSDTIMQGHLQQNRDSMELIELLLKASKMDHCFLTSSGAMAIENALKISFQKRFPAQRVLAFERCFAGRTLATAQITDKAAFRDGLPPTLVVDYIPFFDPSRPEESTKAAVEALNKHISRYPKQHAAFVLELIQGEGGFHMGTTPFFKAILDIAKQNEIAIIIDEIQSFGRTPEMFAFQYFSLDDYVDIVTIGKLSQVCATLYRTAFKPRPGLLSQTFTSSTTAIRAGALIVDRLLHDGYMGPNGKIAQLSDYVCRNLESLSKRHPQLIKGPFGIGTMIAFTPLDGSQDKVTKFAQLLFDEGVIGFTAGNNPTRVRFLLPVGAASYTDVDQVITIIERCLKQMTPS